MSLRFASNRAFSLSSKFLRPATTASIITDTTTKTSQYQQKHQSPPQYRHFSSIPDMERAKTMRPKIAEMENETLTIIANMGNHQAGCEVLKRHIMSVDNVNYEEACRTFTKIEEANQGTDVRTIPYFVGIGAGMFMAAGSLPMVFDLTTAKWFNELYVTTDVPEAVDLETWLEVGSWTWNWMEPPLGTLSFMLLCLQFTRSQIQNLGLKPYTEMVIQQRADKLADKFPKYDRDIIHMYSESEPLVKNSWLKLK